MRNLVEIVGLESELRDRGVQTPVENFEAFYDDLVSKGSDASLVAKIEDSIRDYFSGLELPTETNLYDYLLLSLREKDLVATFNWDPFLAQAYRRNMHVQRLPTMVFLHGNVEIAACVQHRKKGFSNHKCDECGQYLTPTRLLYPVKQKNYSAELTRLSRTV